MDKGIPIVGENKHRVLLGVVTSETLPFQFLVHWSNLLLSSKNWKGFNIKDSALVYHGRNDIVESMYRNECSGILFIDSDQTFSPRVLDVLLEQKKDIVGVPIVRKKTPYFPNVGKRNEDGSYRIYEEYPIDHIFQVDYIGMGCTYISKTVFDTIEKPYFFPEKRLNAEDQDLGEDVAFCRKAKEAGFKIWAYPFERVGHLGLFDYGQEIYQQYKEILKYERGQKKEVS